MADPLLLESLSRHVAERPAAVAVTDGSTRLTYAELASASGVLAGQLQRRGAGPGTVVAILCVDRLTAVCAQVAVLAAGAAFLPLDPANPAYRVGVILDDADPALVVTDMVAASCPERWHRARLPVGVPSAPGPGHQVDPAAVRPDDVAAVLYTSGSTGSPKGVEIPHSALANLCEWYRGTFRTRLGMRTSMVAALGFDAVVFEAWAAWTTGGELRVAPDQVRRHAEDLARWIAENDVELAFLPTALATLLFGHGWTGTDRLHTVLVGGEAFRAHVPPGFRGRVVDCYGPTETTVFAFWQDVGRQQVGAGAVRRTQVHVMDRTRRPVPSTDVGEIFLTGAGLGLGYLGRPELTAERFTAVDLDGAGVVRAYATGDLARWKDGRLEFCGRVDRQAKVAGSRLEPGEIEAVLSTHPAVALVAVTVRPDGDLPHLTACYVAAEAAADRSTDQVDAELRALCADRLPRYMVPQVFLRRAELPLNHNGKVDHSAIAGELASWLPAVDGPPRPTSAVEALWHQVLAPPAGRPVGDFFGDGGTSILLSRLLYRVHAELGRRVYAAEFMRRPTLEHLEMLVRSGAADH